MFSRRSFRALIAAFAVSGATALPALALDQTQAMVALGNGPLNAQLVEAASGALLEGRPCERVPAGKGPLRLRFGETKSAEVTSLSFSSKGSVVTATIEATVRCSVTVNPRARLAQRMLPKQDAVASARLTLSGDPADCASGKAKMSRYRARGPYKAMLTAAKRPIKRELEAAALSFFGEICTQ